jgi:hypothetical protein
MRKAMPEFKNKGNSGMPSGENISDEVVSKVGKAVGRIVGIKQAYKDDLAAAETSDEQQELSQRVEQEAIEAISRQGLSLEQYNEVITAADDDPDLEKRLLTAAREAR